MWLAILGSLISAALPHNPRMDENKKAPENRRFGYWFSLDHWINSLSF
jgi:hypothetical protein